MSEQLIPKEGDRVRLVHTNGDEAFVGVQEALDLSTGRKGIEAAGADFWFDEGWSVAEILEKPLPPEGTFVQGLLHEGDDPFVGRATGDAAFPFSVLSLSGVNGRVAAAAIKSWEVVK